MQSTPSPEKPVFPDTEGDIAAGVDLLKVTVNNGRRIVIVTHHRNLTDAPFKTRIFSTVDPQTQARNSDKTATTPLTRGCGRSRHGR